MGRISAAADEEQEGYGPEGHERDVEAELLDIMEIDRELDQLESDREHGTKRVFFEEG